MYNSVSRRIKVNCPFPVIDGVFNVGDEVMYLDKNHKLYGKVLTVQTSIDNTMWVTPDGGNSGYGGLNLELFEYKIPIII